MHPGLVGEDPGYQLGKPFPQLLLVALIGELDELADRVRIHAVRRRFAVEPFALGGDLHPENQQHLLRLRRRVQSGAGFKPGAAEQLTPLYSGTEHGFHGTV
ncbi:hypothetical protein D3C75_597580 [compost metagenome]